MKICIPTETNEGKAAKVYGHFGSAPYFAIYDTETNSVEVIGNPNQHHSHGTCHPMSALKDKSIDIVVCGGMGARAVQKLNAEGIKTYRIEAGTVEEIVKNLQNGKLEEITAQNACAHHGWH